MAFRSNNSMLNLLVFAALIGIGCYLRLSASFFVLTTIGAVCAVGSGFASFSRGRMFSRGRGDVIAVVLFLADVLLAIAVGWLYGVAIGIAAFVVFWPVMYRLGAKMVRRVMRRLA